MHVHVVAPDGEVKFWLEPQIAWALNRGLKSIELTECINTLAVSPDMLMFIMSSARDRWLECRAMKAKLQYAS